MFGRRTLTWQEIKANEESRASYEAERDIAEESRKRIESNEEYLRLMGEIKKIILSDSPIWLEFKLNLGSPIPLTPSSRWIKGEVRYWEHDPCKRYETKQSKWWPYLTEKDKEKIRKHDF